MASGCGRYVAEDEPREEMVQRLVCLSLFAFSNILGSTETACLSDHQAWEIAGCPALLNTPFEAGSDIGPFQPSMSCQAPCVHLFTVPQRILRHTGASWGIYIKICPVYLFVLFIAVYCCICLSPCLLSVPERRMWRRWLKQKFYRFETKILRERGWAKFGCSWTNCLQLETELVRSCKSANATQR